MTTVSFMVFPGLAVGKSDREKEEEGNSIFKKATCSINHRLNETHNKIQRNKTKLLVDFPLSAKFYTTEFSDRI